MKLNFGDLPVETHKERDGLYFHILKTKDDSPTCFTSDSETGEAETMHSSQGAFTETDYIYGEAVRKILEFNKEKYRFLNLGIGIGYNELSIACHFLKEGLKPDSCYIGSFELYPELSQSLKNFYENSSEHSFLGKYHCEILELYANHFHFSKEEIKAFLKEMIQKDHWQFFGAIGINSFLPSSIDCFLFDAYSSNTDPELWTPEFLDHLLSRSNCPSIFTTYAATGELKRALKSREFITPKRKGFAFKRESTLAFKLSK